jgi:flagellar motor switch/type III secretory pathway protein FliN
MNLSEPAAPHSGAAHPPVLPHLQPAAVALQRHLLVHVPCSDWRLGDGPGAVLQSWRWCAATEHTAPTDAGAPGLSRVLVLADGANECLLCLHSETAVGIDMRIDLSAFDDEALLLAASLRYANLLAHLSAITARDWQCVQVHHAADAWAAGLLSTDLTCMGFTLRAAPTDGAEGAVADLPTTRGQVHVHRNDLARWHAAQGHAAAAPAVLQTLSIGFDIVVPSAPMTTAELRELRVGAAVLLCRAEPGAAQAVPLCACVLRAKSAAHGKGAVENGAVQSAAQASGHCSALLQGHQLRVTGPWRTGPMVVHRPHSAIARSPTMFDNPSQADPGDIATSDPSDSTHNLLDSLPMAVEFHLGQLQLPLADLAQQLVPGQVFELGQALGPHSVAVCANGIELARGELLQVGDLLAVRITAVHGAAQRQHPAGSQANTGSVSTLQGLASETAPRGSF